MGSRGASASNGITAEEARAAAIAKRVFAGTNGLSGMTLESYKEFTDKNGRELGEISDTLVKVGEQKAKEHGYEFVKSGDGIYAAQGAHKKFGDDDIMVAPTMYNGRYEVAVKYTDWGGKLGLWKTTDRAYKSKTKYFNSFDSAYKFADKIAKQYEK